MEELFRAYFVDAEDVGEVDVQKRIGARAVSMPAASTNCSLRCSAPSS